MTDELDLFDQLAGAEAPAEPSFEELPTQAWVLGKTANEENGGAAPNVRSFDRKDGSGSFFKFKIGLICAGGDGKITNQHKGRYAFFEVPLDPWKNDKGPINGKLAGFMNAVLATGVGSEVKDAHQKSTIRWQASMAKLQEFAKSNPTIDGEAVTLSAYGGDKARYLAGLLKAYLLESQCKVLFKTVLNKDKETGEVYGVQAGSIEEATSQNITKRKVKAFEDDGLAY